ncbi:MAG: universal stress protein [Rubellimicrobium sp.]|nr:universal stress protein [Rubellimicrobium sp.]
MGYKSISVIVTDAATDGPAVSAALAIAAREDAHLDLHCIGIDPTRYEMAPMGATAVLLDSGLAEARERSEALAEWVRGQLPLTPVRASVVPAIASSVGYESMIARLARYSDLIVAARPYGTGRGLLSVSTVEAVLFGTDAPVLIVPPDGGAFGKPFSRIVAAWDEGDESLSAIRKAIPMMQAAEHVDIVIVDPQTHSPERSDPGGMLCVMLARHGIRAEVSILSRTLPRISEVLTRFLRDRDAEALVMGAYGHSRFRQAILGGPTRDMLETAELPLIMAH